MVVMVDKQLRIKQKKAILQPYQQGDFDALCGVYSVVNALHWLLYDDKQLSDYRANRFSENAFFQLNQNRCLKRAVVDGMSLKLWKRLILDTVNFSRDHYGLNIVVEEIVQSCGVGELLKTYLDNDKVILTHLTGYYNHYTVIVGYTDNNWELFDSDGMQYIRQSSVKRSFDRKRSRYSFSKNGLLCVSLIP